MVMLEGGGFLSWSCPWYQTCIYGTIQDINFRGGWIEEEIIRFVGKEIYETVCITWRAQLLLVKKKEGSTKLCVDYQQFIKVVIEIKYPLQRDWWFDWPTGRWVCL